MLSGLTFVKGHSNSKSMVAVRKVLFVNLPKSLADQVEEMLTDEGLTCLQSFGFGESMQMARLHIPDVYIIMEGKEGTQRGMEMIRSLRDSTIFDQSRILYLAGDASEDIQMRAFEAGAEDILPEQVSIRILSTRIASLLKRLTRSVRKIEMDGHFTVDPECLTVTLDGKHIDLVKKEFELLHLLCSAPNRIFYRKEILNHIWKDSNLKSDRTLDVHIRKLRKKLGIPNIKTVNGVGYKFEWSLA
jgi:two-component system, OmpR family, alkaline phosphatase synthesis response regulator PhoP